MVFFLLGVLFWYLGRQMSDEARNHDVRIIELISGGWVVLPYILYLLCGLPTSKVLPHRTVTARSLMAQLTGILFLIVGYLNYGNIEEIKDPKPFLLIPMAGIIIGYFLKKVYPYEP